MTLKTALERKNIPEIRKIVRETPMSEIADLLEKMKNRDRIVFFRVLDTATSAAIFSSLQIEFQKMLIKQFTVMESKSILEYLYANDIADLIEEVPANIATKILEATPKRKRHEINKILKYTDQQTGSVMSVDIVLLSQAWTAEAALRKINEKKHKNELVHYYFVINQKKKLVGAVALEDLVFAERKKKLRTIMHPTKFVTTTTDKEASALIFSDQTYSVLPVVNSSGFLVGMITADDVLDILQDEATEDMQKMAGIDVVSTPYLKTTIQKLFRSRIIWLLLLMISSTVSQIVLDAFIGISSRALNATTTELVTGILTSSLIAIIPVISGAAGNAGSQASTMVTRAIALGDIARKDGKKVISKEFRVALLLGFVLAVANFARLMIYYGAKGMLIATPKGYRSYPFIWISVGASLSLWVVIIFAKIVGGSLPLIAAKLKIDPAVMAAPLLTTLIDALSTLIFFGITIGILVVTIIP